MITLKELDNGNLLITLNKGHKRELKQMLKDAHGKYPERSIALLADILDESGYIGNGWDVNGADDFGQMTECHLIAYNFSIPEGKEEEDYYSPDWFEKAWTYLDYQVHCPVEQLLEYGQVEFQKWD